MESWQQIRAAEDAKVRAQGHAFLVAAAAKLMPHLSAAESRRMRVAMLAGPGHGLRELVQAHDDIRRRLIHSV